MKKVLMIFALSIWFVNRTYATVLPPWFMKAFIDQGLDRKYSIIEKGIPMFLEADLNGDKKNDVAVQIINKANKKKGILIINFGQNKSYVFGAGIKFKNESFDTTNWLNGWKINRSKIVYETMFKPDGDIIGGRKISIKYPAISAYMVEDGVQTPVILIYWNESNYVSIHQGD